jgi:dephospho-CoA kinase
MILVGLTGSIGMGKSETARMFRALGVPVYEADAAVHRLYNKGGSAVEPIEAAFPGVAKDGAVDRQELGKRVLADPEALKRLESIIHPLVGAEQRSFLQQAEDEGVSMVVLDIPLLFETGGEKRVDTVVVVSAPYEIQRQRVLERFGMTEEKFASILAKQTPDAEKRARADFVIETDKGLDHARDQVREVIAALKGREGRAWAERRKVDAGGRA